MGNRISIDVTFPRGAKRTFKSVSAVARMLSGKGRANGYLRDVIEEKAFYGLMPDVAPAGQRNPNVFRGHKLYG